MKKKSLSLFIIGMIVCLNGVLWASGTEKFDVLIRNTKIVDGTGKAAYLGNIAVKDEKIIAIGQVEGEALTVIDGTGLITCPGFIDPHSHADRGILLLNIAENLIMQGITTFVGGNCGLSPAPQKKLTFGAWLSRVEKRGISVNMVPLVGHSSIRNIVMGKDFKREATQKEIEAMMALLEEAMQSGAHGFSAGVDPPWPGFFASMEEKVALGRVAGRYGGYYCPHTRHERSHWFTDNIEDFSYPLYYGPPEEVLVGRYQGLLEAIEVCRQADIPLHIAHIPNAYMLNLPHPDYLEEAAARATMEILENANKEGVQVTCDVVFPVFAQFTQLIVNEFLNPVFQYPEWLSGLKKEEFLEKLKDPEFQGKIRQLYDDCRMKFSMIHTKADPYWFDCFKVFAFKEKDAIGKTIGELAKQKKMHPLDVVFELVMKDPDTVWLHFLDRRYNDVAVSTILQHPLTEPCTDIGVSPAQLGSGHRWLMGPATWGVYPHYIDTYVKQKGLFSLEEAVRKATSVPAKRLGLNRGVLKPGTFADILVFDLGNLKMTGDFTKPDQCPTGIEYVLVNGTIVYRDMAHTGELPGKVIRKKKREG